MNINQRKHHELTLNHLQLEGLRGRDEIVALNVTETGIAPIELIDTDHPPALWCITDEYHQQLNYGDSLRELIQNWCKREVSQGLAVNQESVRHRYSLASSQLPMWSSELIQENVGVIARFNNSDEAQQWIALLTATMQGGQDDCVTRYLNTPLPYKNLQNRWWMPLLLREQPFKATSVQVGHLYLTGCEESPVPEQWWEIPNIGKAQKVIAEFRMPAMAMAFSAAQFYRLTSTYRDLAPDEIIAMKGRHCVATVVDAPALNQLTPASTVKIRFKENHETEVQAQELTWVAADDEIEARKIYG